MAQINEGAKAHCKFEAAVTRQPIASWNGFVALLDILGFRALVSSHDFQQKMTRYSAILEDATAEYQDLGYLTFSDTIVVYSKRSAETSKETLRYLLDVVGNICFHSLQKLNWPIRGCVTSGPLTTMRAPSGMILAGRAIIDAYHYETRQDWVGVMVSPGLIASHDDATDYLEENICIYPYSKIPLRDDNGSVGEFDGYVVMPKVATTDGHPSVHSARDSTIAYSKTLNRLSIYAPSVSAQEKYKRSSRWLASKELENWFSSLEALR